MDCGKISFGLMRELFIAGHRIADDTPAFVCAELGNNHQGSLQKCKDLIYAAKECGVDAVKLQKRDLESCFTPELLAEVYNSEHSFGRTYGEHRAALELGWHDYLDLQVYASKLGLVFFATAFDEKSADFLNMLSVPCFKIASGDLTNLLLIKHVCSFGKPVIISTGGGTLVDIERVYVETMGIREVYGTQIAFLQCTAAYPCPIQQMDLRVIETLREDFPGLVIGLSDHQDGIDMAPVAYTLGARIIEKHFTLDHNAKGSDHRFSLEPDGMRHMIQSLRRVHEALGDGTKKFYESELVGLRKMRKAFQPDGTLKSPWEPGMKTDADVEW